MSSHSRWMPALASIGFSILTSLPFARRKSSDSQNVTAAVNEVALEALRHVLHRGHGHVGLLRPRRRAAASASFVPRFHSLTTRG